MNLRSDRAFANYDDTLIPPDERDPCRNCAATAAVKAAIGQLEAEGFVEPHTSSLAVDLYDSIVSTLESPSWGRSVTCKEHE